MDAKVVVDTVFMAFSSEIRREFFADHAVAPENVARMTRSQKEIGDPGANRRRVSLTAKDERIFGNSQPKVDQIAATI